MRLRELAVKAKHLTVKGYRFGKKVHGETKLEIERIQKQRQDERLRKASRKVEMLKQRRKELKKFNEAASLREEMGRLRRKRKPKRNPFEVRF